MQTFLASAVLVGCIAGAACAQTVPAYPGAEGAGMNATGGRGGKIVHVTNLNASGPGSLQDAVSEGDRIVVFDVSGIIDLSNAKLGKDGKPKKEGKEGKGGTMSIDQPNITIAGQTAPGEGICLKGGELHVGSSNVIVRYLRSRRGFIREGTSGDAIEVKPTESVELTAPSGQTQERFEKRQQKKASRGKFVHGYEDLNDIIIDHCSTSWATDENLTVTHTGRATVSYSIAAEGLDYTNPRQTPPNHSEGSLWGSSAPDGRSTMHHMLYAHNRLRNPRTVGGSDVPPVLTFYNNVVYDWSEYPTHTGSERVHLLWLSNFYKPGPSTPANIRSSAFQFHGDPQARVFASGNFIDGSPEATQNNRLAIGYSETKFKKVSAADRALMIVDKTWTELPASLQSATAAFETVMDDVGATLPARDAVDLRLVQSVRQGGGHVIEKETDLPADQRWPDYHSLPPPHDSDHDGLPDFWEQQFGLNPQDATDSAQLSHGYANIEHYFNNTDPTGALTPIVFVAATVSREHVTLGGTGDQFGEWRITRSGDLTQDLTVHYTLTRDDAHITQATVLIPAGKASALVRHEPGKDAKENGIIVLKLDGNEHYHIGCPCQSLIVTKQ